MIDRVARYRPLNSSVAVFVCFLLSCSVGGGATAAAAVLTLDTAFDESRRRRQRVWLGLRIVFQAETGTHVTITAWNVIFSFLPPLFLLAFCLVSPSVSFSVPAILLTVSPSPSCCLVRAAASCPS